jgi:alkanesulfonate monooxygenase SsuD/methylene tetrahydromethanopterin reductase-like flavin-dependent oxidoreductase (luciferase family)
MEGGLGDLSGKYYQVKNSNLYTKPLQPIPVFVAALGPQSARLAGQEAEGFVTNEANPELIKKQAIACVQRWSKEGWQRPRSARQGAVPARLV